MSNNYSFNAPTYFDFNPDNQTDEAVEMYFEIDHEYANASTACARDPLATDDECDQKKIQVVDDSISAYTDIVDDMKMSSHFSTPISEIIEISDDQMKPPRLRRSISTGGLDLIGKIQNGIRLSNLNLGGNNYNFKRNKSASQDRIDQLAMPKQIQNNFVSTAEQISKFYGTLHSKSKIEDNAKRGKAAASTIPRSPALETKLRHREKRILSSEEQEMLEIEEYKKLHMKALPLNPKVLQGRMKPQNVFKKPSTIVHPFRLTESHPIKTDQMPENHRNVSRKPNLQPMRAGSGTDLTNLTRTQPIPFSFEARDKIMAKRRQEKINKLLEQEKKAREFRANPLPKYEPVPNVKKSTSLNSLKSNRSEDESREPPRTFKAKPPTVLYQKPFEPKKPERPLVEVPEFSLNTQRRAKDREEYEKKMQERRDRIAMEKLRREEELTKYEKDEIAKLRKERVHNAQPIRYYKDVKVEHSSMVTVPKSPYFRTAQRLHLHDKENSGEYID